MKIIILFLSITIFSCGKVGYNCQQVELVYSQEITNLTLEYQNKVNSLLNSNYSPGVVSSQIRVLSEQLDNRVKIIKNRYKQKYPSCDF
jgi:hypothetical protein